MRQKKNNTLKSNDSLTHFREHPSSKLINRWPFFQDLRSKLLNLRFRLLNQHLIQRILKPLFHPQKQENGRPNLLQNLQKRPRSVFIRDRSTLHVPPKFADEYSGIGSKK